MSELFYFSVVGS